MIGLLFHVAISRDIATFLLFIAFRYHSSADFHVHAVGFVAVAVVAYFHRFIELAGTP
jgi:hypothetical protein